MTRDELADTVFRQIECLWILQEITREIDEGNKNAELLLDKIYHRRNPDINWRRLHFLEIKTTCAMLILPVCFVSKLTEHEFETYGFAIRDKYDLLYREDGVPVALPRSLHVLRTMRNALAHLPDFVAGSCPPNVAFDEGILRLWSDRNSSEVVFLSRPGFVKFIADMMHVAQLCANQLANPQ